MTEPPLTERERSIKDGIETICRKARNAPPTPNGPLPSGLEGWRINCDPGYFYICAYCAGQIFARGCDLGDADPVWSDDDGKGVCQLCGHGVNKRRGE